jgi:predicted acyl esterase
VIRPASASARSRYVVATADVRGNGTSFGARRSFLIRLRRMTARADQVAGEEAMVSGQVGLVGCSYPGGSAMLIADTLPR